MERKSKRLGKPNWWKWFVLMDAYMQYFFVRIFFRNRLIVFDRFFLDYLVSFDYLELKYDKNKLLNHFPMVDRYFLLTASYNILYKRKPEHTVEFFKQCRVNYLKLVKINNMKILDSGEYNEYDIMKRLLQKI